MRTRHTRLPSWHAARPRPMHRPTHPVPARRPTIAVAALASATAVLLAACSPPAAPTAGTFPATTSLTSVSTAAPTMTTAPTDPAPTPAPTPTWPPQITLPTPPAEMARGDEAGAVAAAKYFLDLYTYTESTQDTGPWLALSHADCKFCSSVVEDVASRRSAHQVVRSAPMTVTAQAVEALSPVAFSVSITVIKRPEELWTTDEALIRRDVDAGGRFVFVLLRNPGAWTVRAVTPLDPVSL